MDLPVNELVCGDVLEVLKDFPDESIDLVVTDPPYNISNYGNLLTKKDEKIVRADFGNWDKWENIEEYFDWCVLWIKEIERLLKKKGSIYVFFDNHYADHLSYLIEKQTTLRQKTPIVLRKTNPIPHIRKTNYRSGYERATLFVKDEDKKPKTFNFLSQRLMVNVIDYPIGKKETNHPTEKPLEPIEIFVKVSSNKEDIVLDPFVGSGTTCLVAQKLGRNWIGIDLKPEYIEMAKKRLEPFMASRLTEFMDHTLK